MAPGAPVACDVETVMETLSISSRSSTNPSDSLRKAPKRLITPLHSMSTGIMATTGVPAIFVPIERLLSTEIQSNTEASLKCSTCREQV